MKITKGLLTSVVVVIMVFRFVFCALADTSATAFMFGTFTDGFFGTFTDGFFGSGTDGFFGSDTDGDKGPSTDGWDIIMGDIDNDFTITASDSRLVLRAGVGLEDLSPRAVNCC